MPDVTKRLGIVVELRDGQLVARGLKEIAAAGDQAAKSADNLNDTLRTLAGAFALLKLSQWEKETVGLAARYQTLGVALDVVGRSAGKTAGQLADIQAGLQKTGISAIEARANMLRLIQAQISLSQANDLARVAQNAAVIANENSSETFARLVHGIQSGHVIILRNIGLNVNFEEGYKKLAKTLGTTTENLTAEQKMQARVNEAMEAGSHIVGAYEAALGTAGKQIKSAERFLEDMRVKVGQAFLPEYTALVFKYAEGLKLLANNAPFVVGGIVAITTAIVALGLAIKGNAILAFLASLASAPVAITAAGIATLAIVLGSAATNAAIARKEASEFTEALKHMRTQTLENMKASAEAAQETLRQRFSQGQVTERDVERFKQLGSYITEYTRQINENKQAEKIAADQKKTQDAAIDEQTKKKIQTSRDELALITALNNAYGSSALDLELIRIRQEEVANANKVKNEAGSKELLALNLAISAGKQWAAVLEDQKQTADHLIESLKQLDAQQHTTFGMSTRDLSNLDVQATRRGGGYDALPTPTVARRPIGPDLIAQKKYLDDMHRVWMRGLNDIVTDGLNSFNSFFDKVLSLFTRLMERMVREGKDMGVGYKLLGVGSAAIAGGFAGYSIGNSSGSGAMGAIGGAASGAILGGQIAGPWGAAAGAMVGAVAGLVGAANKLKELRKQFAETESNYINSLKVYATSYQQTYAQIEDSFKQLQDAARAAKTSVSADAAAAHQQALERNRGNFLIDLADQMASLQGEAGAFDQQLNAIEKTYQNNIETIRTLGLGETQLAQAELIRKTATENLIKAEARAADISQDLLQRYASITGATLSGGDQFASLRKAIADAERQGLTELATSLKQELFLDEQFKAQLDALDAQKKANELAQKARQDAIRFQEDVVARLDQQLQLQRSTVEALRQSYDTIASLSDSLKLSRVTPLSIRDQYLEAKRQYDAVANAAAGGDQGAIANLPQFTQAFLELSRRMFGSTSKFQDDYNQVQTFLGTLKQQFGEQLTTEEKIYAELQKQSDLAKAQLDAMKQSDIDVLQGLQDQLNSALVLMGPGYAQSADANNRRFQIQYLSQYVGMGLSITDLLRNIAAMSQQAGTDLSQDLTWRALTQNLPSYLLPKLARGGMFRGMAEVAEGGPEVIVSGRGAVFNAAQWNAPVIDELRGLRYRIDRLIDAQNAQTNELRRNNDVTSVVSRRGR